MKSVALAMIARDEQRCIARCLDSVRPWVDRMVVLDTGSSDATVQLARQHGAVVHAAPWEDDFSLARNRVLALADADWCVVLDADEWLVDGGPQLAALRDATARFAGQLRVDSEFDVDHGVGVAPSWMARVAPRGAAFVGRIHEQLQPGLARRRLDVRVGHDGYRRAHQDAKRGRNEALLRRALQDHPEDPYLHYQLGKDLEHWGQWEVACTHYEHACNRGADTDSWRHDLVVRRLYALKRTRRFEQALAWAEAQGARWGGSPDYHFVVGDLLLDLAIARPHSATTLLPQIESSWKTCLALGEHPELEGSVQGRGSYLAAHNLAAFHGSLGHAGPAEGYRRLEAELRRRHATV